MRCETCQGTGQVLQMMHGDFARGVDDIEQRLPCPACGGTGIQSCCEGNCGGPDETTNGPAQPLPPALSDRVACGLEERNPR